MAQPVLHELRSILEPVAMDALFASSAPLEIELGSGDGSFLAALAAARPARNFIGIERLLGRARKLERKARRLDLKNLRVIRIESAYFLRYLVPRHAAAAIHVYFPDPWPKRKHRRHRLINEDFPAIAAGALAPGGTVHLRTDDADYFDQMQRVFASAAPAFVPAETPAELAAILTDFERGFQSKGIGTHRASYRLVSH
ncbi:MAG TPA: tRNA (guanosine(46)-N7)-methyltransferase TrmB [Verrucomicrobiae bacterium]|nr:tRNA (guanosine(46)-N7)-methyltransferase TrmB [Verrucomicrobiae bacterium]